MNATGLILAFLMGLTGSLHCAGMCGPIMLILPFQYLTGIKKYFAVGLYHFGRISVYAFFGLLIYAFKATFKPEWQQYISITLGGILLLTGILSFFSRYNILKLPWTEYVTNRLSSTMGMPTFARFLLTGVLNGLLPCGLVYMALSAAVTATTVLQAIAIMYAFGVGTLPMLIGITVIGGKLRVSSQKMKKIVPMAMVFFGCLFIVRGLNLGVPYLSPRLSNAPAQVKTVVCHKY